MAVTLIVPGVPVAKGRPKFARIGGFMRAYTPKKTRDYENFIASIAHKTMSGKPPFECPLKVWVVIYQPIPQSFSKKQLSDALAGLLLPAKKPDIDNLAKAALDACNGIVWRDDALICKILVEKVYSDKPRLELTVAPLEYSLFNKVKVHAEKS